MRRDERGKGSEDKETKRGVLQLNTTEHFLSIDKQICVIELLEQYHCRYQVL